RPRRESYGPRSPRSANPARRGPHWPSRSDGLAIDGFRQDLAGGAAAPSIYFFSRHPQWPGAGSRVLADTRTTEPAAHLVCRLFAAGVVSVKRWRQELG